MCPTLVFPKDGFAQSVQIKQYKPCPLSLEVNRSIKPNENGIPVFKKSLKFYKLYFKGSFTLNCYITTPQCKSIQVLSLKTYLLLQTDLIPLSAAVAVFFAAQQRADGRETFLAAKLNCYCTVYYTPSP